MLYHHLSEAEKRSSGLFTYVARCLYTSVLESMYSLCTQAKASSCYRSDTTTTIVTIARAGFLRSSDALDVMSSPMCTYCILLRASILPRRPFHLLDR